MFVENSDAAQRKMFTVESELDDRLQKKLKGHWSVIFYEKVFLGIDETIFSPLYCLNNGRPNFPVNILVGIEILKEAFNLTDEQVFERYSFDLAFRRSLGLTDFNEHILAEKTLYNFRAALAQYNREHATDLMEPVFRELRDDIIEELGVKTGKQRIDSTLIGANIKKMNRLMLFHKVLSNLVRDMKKCEIEISKAIEEVLGDDEDRFTYRLKREHYDEVLLKIAGYLYRLVAGHVGDKRICGHESYHNAKRLLDEQCRVTKKKRKIELKNAEEISASSMQNPADPDAAYRKKNNEAHQGYSTVAAETCDPENKMQVVMDVDVMRNNVDDAAVLADVIEEYKEENGLETIVADGGFVSNGVRDECIRNDVEIITSAIRGKQTEVNVESLSSKDFTCDEKTGEILMCPTGIKPRSSSVDGTVSRANFERNKCLKCKKQRLCPVRISATQARYVVDDARRWIDDRQERMKTGEYQKLCALRPPVEGLMSQLKPKYLKGRIKFRGLVKVKNRMVMRAIAINFKRYRAYMLDISCYLQKNLFDLSVLGHYCLNSA